MTKVKVIGYDKLNWSDKYPLKTVGQKLEDFINQVGYENIKQILFSGSFYTVIYEE